MVIQMTEKGLKREKLLWSLFRHDMANKLIVSRGYIGLKMFSKAKKALDDMENIIKLYDQFMQTDHVIEMSLEHLIDNVNEMLEGTKPEIKCQKSEMQLDPLFVAIFYNLVTNSQKHSGRDNDLVIRIEEEEGRLIFTDNGKGIDKGGKNIFGAPGHALTIIRQLGREVLNFQIQETGVFGEGVRFEITF